MSLKYNEMPDILELLRLVRTLKSQIEILEGMDQPANQKTLVQNSLKELMKTINLYLRSNNQ